MSSENPNPHNQLCVIAENQGYGGGSEGAAVWFQLLSGVKTKIQMAVLHHEPGLGS